MISRSPGEAPPSSQTGDCNLYVYVKKVHVNGRTYYYLVVEEYEGRGKRRRIAHISPNKKNTTTTSSRPEADTK